MEKNGGKLLLQWETHSKQTSRGLCMLMERQCLVDIAICCGSNTLHAHKCILAAHSMYFKENLDNKAIEQIIVNGVDFSVMKSLIEFMYCGECVVAEEHLKLFIAAVKMFKISTLEAIFAENEYQNLTADEVCIPNPQFVCKPPKYPTVYKPFTNASMPPKINYALNNVYSQHKFKRKCFGSEAEKACAKEAQASRIALANLRKVMASTPQVHSFIVEESFNETTVENFIPTVEENYENLNDVQFVSETQNNENANVPKLLPITTAPSNTPNNQGLTADKIKRILGNDDVEIMFQTSDGNFVNVSDEVLLNLSKSGLQYQVVDENGQVGELQELKSLVTETVTSNCDTSTTFPQENNNTIIINSNKDETFALKIIKNSDEIDKITKAMSEEYIDPNFETTTKTNLDSIPLHTSFNDGLYENTFQMQNPEIFEPENLSMHSALMTDNGIGFDNDIKYKYLTPKMTAVKGADDNTMELDDGENSANIINSETLSQINNTKEQEGDGGSGKTTLKFSADMFFADLPGNGCTAEANKKSGDCTVVSV